MATVTINVTQDDIVEGVILECEFCPIARAIKRRFGIVSNYSVVDVSSNSVTFYGGKLPYGFEVCKLPDIALNFINDFDQGRIPEPISFLLEYPDNWRQL